MGAGWAFMVARSRGALPAHAPLIAHAGVTRAPRAAMKAPTPPYATPAPTEWCRIFLYYPSLH